MVLEVGLLEELLDILARFTGPVLEEMVDGFLPFDGL